jgi:hypothetical protein
MDGTTKENEKWPLILKDFSEIKTTDNKKSIT